MHLQVPKEPPLRKEMKRGFQSQKGDNTTLSTGCKRWPREKSRKLFIWWCWYIMMAHNIMIFLYEIFVVKIQIVLQVNYNFVVWNIHLKGLFPHPNLSEFNLLSYLTSFLFVLTYTLDGSLESKFLEDNSYKLFGGTEDFIIIFMVLNIILENYFEDVLSLVGLEIWQLWWDFRLLVAFV